jgi:hypothetical protein
MPSEGFEPAITTIERLQTYALDGAASGTDEKEFFTFAIKFFQLWNRISEMEIS